MNWAANWAVIGGGVAGVAALLGGGGTLLVRRRRRLRTRMDSAEEAAAAADNGLAGFRSAGAVLAEDGATALAVSANDRVALVMMEGRRVAVREISWRSLRSIPGGMVVERADRRRRDVPLAGVDVLEVRRLLPEAARHVLHH